MADYEVKMLRDTEIKASESQDEKMRFEGYLAYFGNVDSYGDVIVAGAFDKTLKDIKSQGKTVPVLEQHGGWGSSAGDYTPVGYYEDLKEDTKGLYVKGVLYTNTRGKDMHILLKESPQGAMGQSIGYRVRESKTPSSEETRKTGVYRYLTELDLIERLHRDLPRQ